MNHVWRGMGVLALSCLLTANAGSLLAVGPLARASPVGALVLGMPLAVSMLIGYNIVGFSACAPSASPRRAICLPPPLV